MPMSAAFSAMSATVPTTVRCPGVEAAWIHGGGTVRRASVLDQELHQVASLRTPMKITSVCVAVASLDQSCELSSLCGDSVAVRYATLRTARGA